MLEGYYPAPIVLRDTVGCEKANELATDHDENEEHPAEAVLETNNFLGLK